MRLDRLAVEPLPEYMSEEIKLLALYAKNGILFKFKDYINNFVNASIINFFDPLRDNFTEVMTLLLKEIHITKQEYENALKVFDDNGFQPNPKRPTDSCFVKDSFNIGLLSWEANIEIQPVFHYYKAVIYLYSYLSK